jgi:hypothetical protein
MAESEETKIYHLHDAIYKHALQIPEVLEIVPLYEALEDKSQDQQE